MMQAGSSRWTGVAAPSGTKAVTFPASFTDTPIIWVVPVSDYITVIPTAKTSTGFTITWAKIDGGSITSADFAWLAIGPSA